MTAFILEVPVRGTDCDPAGSMRSSRYFELVNLCIEDWFAALGLPFAEMHGAAGIGVPTVRIALRLQRPAQPGELLRLQLEVEELRRSAVRLRLAAEVDGAPRFEVDATLVMTRRSAESGHRSMTIPPPLRERMAGYAAASAGLS